AGERAGQGVRRCRGGGGGSEVGAKERRGRFPSRERREASPSFLLPPRYPVTLYQLVRLARPPTAGGVGRHSLGSVFLPIPNEWVDHPPRRLDLVAPREQRRFADHHVEQQGLVCGRGRFAERCRVVEFHLHWRDLDRRRQRNGGPRHLDLEIQRHTLVWLDAHDERIRPHGLLI